MTSIKTNDIKTTFVRRVLFEYLKFRYENGQICGSGAHENCVAGGFGVHCNLCLRRVEQRASAIVLYTKCAVSTWLMKYVQRGIGRPHVRPVRTRAA